MNGKSSWFSRHRGNLLTGSARSRLVDEGILWVRIDSGCSPPSLFLRAELTLLTLFDLSVLVLLQLQAPLTVLQKMNKLVLEKSTSEDCVTNIEKRSVYYCIIFTGYCVRSQILK